MLRRKPIAEDHGDFHEFTVTFWKDRVMLEGHSFPLGALTTQVLNLDPQELVHIHNLCAIAIKKVRGQLFDPRVTKDYFLLSDIQKSVNAALQEIRKLPVYNLLQVDGETAYHLLTALWQNRDEFQRAMQVGSVENQMLWDYYALLASIPNQLQVFQRTISIMLDLYFEGLVKRNTEYYAVGIYKFMTDEKTQDMLEKSFPGPEVSPFYRFSPVQESLIEYSTMRNPDNEKEYVIAERLVFKSAAAFLYTDFYRGLMHGNAPRRCHNCGRYFLLESGYNTCYCNHVAPGETERTCRKVGAHRKETSPEGKTPARLEYDRTYNRLKTRKLRGKISLAEWNRQVAYAQEIKEQAERGELSDAETRKRLAEL